MSLLPFVALSRPPGLRARLIGLHQVRQSALQLPNSPPRQADWRRIANRYVHRRCGDLGIPALHRLRGAPRLCLDFPADSDKLYCLAHPGRHHEAFCWRSNLVEPAKVHRPAGAGACGVARNRAPEASVAVRPTMWSRLQWLDDVRSELHAAVEAGGLVDQRRSQDRFQAAHEAAGRAFDIGRDRRAADPGSPPSRAKEDRARDCRLPGLDRHQYRHAVFRPCPAPCWRCQNRLPQNAIAAPCEAAPLA